MLNDVKAPGGVTTAAGWRPLGTGAGESRGGGKGAVGPGRDRGRLLRAERRGRAPSGACPWLVGRPRASQGSALAFYPPSR